MTPRSSCALFCHLTGGIEALALQTQGQQKRLTDGHEGGGESRGRGKLLSPATSGHYGVVLLEPGPNPAYTRGVPGAR